MKRIELTKGEFALVDDEDFEWISKQKWQCCKVGRTNYAFGSIRKNGKQKRILMHRAIIGDIPKDMVVDHLDGNGLNNQRNNLRIISNSDNLKNRKAHGKSKYIGVTLHKDGFWSARVRIDGKSKHIGRFITEEKAAIARDKAIIASGDRFFKLNILTWE